MKWIGWLAKWAAGAVLAAALSVLTTFWLVQSYLDALLEKWNLGSVEAPQLDVGELFSAFLPNDGRKPAAGRWTSPGPANGEDAADARQPAGGRPSGHALKVDAPVMPVGRPAEAPGTASGGSGDAASGGSGPMDGAIPGAMGAAGGGLTGRTAGGSADGWAGPTDEAADDGGDGSGPGPNAVPVFGRAAMRSGLIMSAEEFNEKRKSLSEADKIDIFTMLYNHVPQEELQRLSGFVEDGITAEEADEIARVMEDYLNPEDLDRLLAILFGE